MVFVFILVVLFVVYALYKFHDSSDDSNQTKKMVESTTTEPQKAFHTSGDVVNDQHIGRDFERAGDYENAIKAYESAFRRSLKNSVDPTPPPNIFMREAIIYRKLKMYEKEVETINRAIKYGTFQTKTTTDKLKNRLPRAQELLEKNN